MGCVTFWATTTVDDPALYAPESYAARGGHPVTGRGARQCDTWRHSGDWRRRLTEPVCTDKKWWRRQESNPFAVNIVTY